MAAQSIVCQAMPVNRPAPSKAAPVQTGPLARPVGGFSQARRTVPYAFNPALNSFGDGMGVPIFVRPDCPPEDSASTSVAPKSQKMSKVGVQNARPQFRSALEQVSYMTNTKLWADKEAEHASRKFAPLRFLGL